MKHISKWTGRDYFRELILLYLFSVICATVYAYINYDDVFYDAWDNKDNKLSYFLGRLTLLAIGIEIALIIYFLPSLIAKFKRKRNSTAIFVLNLFSGGGFIRFITAFCNLDEYNLSQLLFIICFMGGVWVASLIWALCNENKQS